MIYPMDSELYAVVTSDVFRLICKDKSWQRDENARCREEPWYWMVNYVHTLQKDDFVPMAVPQDNLFPPIPYLQVVLDRMLRNLKLCIDKSRQMVMSWLCMAYYTHWALFGSNEQILVQTKKEEDAGNLVRRCEYILSKLPVWMRPYPNYSYRQGSGGRIQFPHNGSEIRGIPGGSGAADQVRSANPSRYFLDEGGFIDEFAGCRACAEACCVDIKIVSTPNVGPFCDFIQDNQKKVA